MLGCTMAGHCMYGNDGDLIMLGFIGREIGEAQETLLNCVFNNEAENTKESLKDDDDEIVMNTNEDIKVIRINKSFF